MKKEFLPGTLFLVAILGFFGSSQVTAQENAKTHNLTPFTKDQLSPELRRGVSDNYVVSGVIDISGLTGNEVWSGGTFEFKHGASIKIGTLSFRLNADKIVAPDGAVVVYTFDPEEIPVKPAPADHGANGVTRSGNGRRGANGEPGGNGTEGTAGLSADLAVISVRQALNGIIKMDLHGQGGGDGGGAGNGGNAGNGNRGRRASDGPISCNSGGGDGGRGGNGGTGGNAGIGGKPGSGGKLVKIVQNKGNLMLIGAPAKRGNPGSPGNGGSRGSGGGGGHGSHYCGGGSGGSHGSNGAVGIIPEPRYNEFGNLPVEF
jgi:hypothetical protein